jgi:hypothetical protein
VSGLFFLISQGAWNVETSLGRAVDNCRCFGGGDNNKKLLSMDGGVDAILGSKMRIPVR